MLHTQPSPPMRGGGIPNIGDARICLFTSQRERRRRHTPSRHREFPPIGYISNDRGQIIWEDAGQRRQVAGFVGHRAGQGDDGGLGGGDAVEVAHCLYVREIVAWFIARIDAGRRTIE